MRDDIVKYLKKEVKNRAENENNKFGIGALYHIEAVVKNAEFLLINIMLIKRYV